MLSSASLSRARATAEALMKTPMQRQVRTVGEDDFGVTESFADTGLPFRGRISREAVKVSVGEEGELVSESYVIDCPHSITLEVGDLLVISTVAYRIVEVLPGPSSDAILSRYKAVKV